MCCARRRIPFPITLQFIIAIQIWVQRKLNAISIIFALRHTILKVSVYCAHTLYRAVCVWVLALLILFQPKAEIL